MATKNNDDENFSIVDPSWRSQLKSGSKKATEPEPIEKYREALESLDKAAQELDQAHSILKDICLDWYGPRGLSVRKVYDDAERLFKAMQEIQCDECGKPIKENCECWRPGWIDPAQ